MIWDPKYEPPSWQSNRFDSPEEDWRNIPEREEYEFEWEDEEWIIKNMPKTIEAQKKSAYEKFLDWKKILKEDK